MTEKENMWFQFSVIIFLCLKGLLIHGVILYLIMLAKELCHYQTNIQICCPFL